MPANNESTTQHPARRRVALGAAVAAVVAALLVTSIATHGSASADPAETPAPVAVTTSTSAAPSAQPTVASTAVVSTMSAQAPVTSEEVSPVEVAPVEVAPAEVAPVGVAPAEVAPVEVAPAAAAPEEAAAVEPAADSSGNWMEELLPQVDPGGVGNWVFERNGAWGASDGNNVYIDPNVPSDKRFSVMVHEYSHLLQAQVFGSLSASVAALGGTSANESTADCMALMQGASWVNYGCRDDLQEAAAAILAGNQP